MKSTSILLGLVITLAACGGEADTADSSPETEANEQTDTASSDTASDTPEADASDSAATKPDTLEDKPSEPATATNVIPARYQGVWDYVEGTCARESDARKEISGKEIIFYESIGTVTSVTPEGDDVVVALDMEGEGETWTQSFRLSLSGTGSDERLSTSDGEKPKAVDDYPSKRC
ncbi:MAG: hypothetical protein AAF687_00485 [Pseudomonadota bacterium]